MVSGTWSGTGFCYHVLVPCLGPGFTVNGLAEDQGHTGIWLGWLRHCWQSDEQNTLQQKQQLDSLTGRKAFAKKQKNKKKKNTVNKVLIKCDFICYRKENSFLHVRYNYRGRPDSVTKSTVQAVHAMQRPRCTQASQRANP